MKLRKMESDLTTLNTNWPMLCAIRTTVPTIGLSLSAILEPDAGEEQRYSSTSARSFFSPIATIRRQWPLQ
jgi:hypothetical protein